MSISTDKAEKLLRFTEKEMLNFTLLSVHKHEVAEKFGVWGAKQFMGKTFDGIHHISFLINAKGEIEHVFDKFILNVLQDASTYPAEDMNSKPLSRSCRASLSLLSIKPVIITKLY